MAQVAIIWRHRPSTDIYNVRRISDDNNRIYLAKRKVLVRHGPWWRLEGAPAREHLPVIFGAFEDSVEVNYCRIEDRRLTRYCDLKNSEESALVVALKLRLCLHHNLLFLSACPPFGGADETSIDFIRDIYSFLHEGDFAPEEQRLLDEMTGQYLRWEEDVPSGVEELLDSLLNTDYRDLLAFAKKQKQCLVKGRWLDSLFHGARSTLGGLEKEELIYLLLSAQLGDYCFNLNDLYVS